jgi:hypothetical protein
MSDETEVVHSSATSLFDLRNVIAVLFAGYGLVLLVVGLFDTTDADLAKTGGLHLNTWTGAAMLVLAVVFFLWARLRPVRPPTPEEVAEARSGPPGH